MQKSANFEFNLPEESEAFDVNHMNENTEEIDRILKAKGDAIENHLANKNNPHGVSADDVGLGNVPNVSTNNQTPTYDEATDLETLRSGEKIFVAFGKIAKAVSTLISHVSTAATVSVLGHVKVDEILSSTSTNPLQNKSVNSALSTKVDKVSVLSTISECEASTTDSDIAGASALAELNDSLKTKALFDKGNNGANYFYENTYTSMIVPYSTTWNYNDISPSWYYVIAIHFTSTHTMQYWLGLTGFDVYSRITNNSGATWTVNKLH